MRLRPGRQIRANACDGPTVDTVENLETQLPSRLRVDSEAGQWRMLLWWSTRQPRYCVRQATSVEGLSKSACNIGRDAARTSGFRRLERKA